MNDIANLYELVGTNVRDVIKSMSFDGFIGSKFYILTMLAFIGGLWQPIYGILRKSIIQYVVFLYKKILLMVKIKNFKHEGVLT